MCIILLCVAKNKSWTFSWYSNLLGGTCTFENRWPMLGSFRSRYCRTQGSHPFSTSCRQNQEAAEHHRQRLLRRCLTEWHLRCRMEKKQREILSQQQEIQRKVAALLDAVSTAKVKAADEPNDETVDAPPELNKQQESSEKVRQSQSRC